MDPLLTHIVDDQRRLRASGRARANGCGVEWGQQPGRRVFKDLPPATRTRSTARTGDVRMEKLVESIAELASHVFLALVSIILMASVCGRLATAIGQPRVVGEMVAGVLMGPSLLGLILPSVQGYLFPDEVRTVLYVLSMIGLTFFMFLAGAGIDHGAIGLRSTREALAVGGAGVAAPLILGAGTAWLFADRLSDSGTPLIQLALLLGGALTITAFPMLARILQERNMQSSAMGTLTLLSASVADAAAWIVLAVVLAFAFGGSTVSVVTTLTGVVVFVVAMFTLGRRLLAPIARSVERTGELSAGALSVIVLVVLGSAWTTHALGIHFVFGGFIAGISLPNSPVLRACLRNRLMDMNIGVLLPVFFVYTGLNTDMGGLFAGGALVPVLAITTAAFAGKYLSSLLVMRAQGYSWRMSSAVGSLMNARGLMILIFIGVGLEHGVMNSDLYTILVLIAVLTTVAAMPLYRLSLPRKLEDAERDRPLVPSDAPVPPRAAHTHGDRGPRSPRNPGDHPRAPSEARADAPVPYDGPRDGSEADGRTRA